MMGGKEEAKLMTLDDSIGRIILAAHEDNVVSNIDDYLQYIVRAL